MTSEIAAATLKLLAELLPEHAPGMTDELVDRWRESHARPIGWDEALGIARHLAAHWTEPRFPSPADFTAAKRDLAIRAEMAAAREQVRSAHDHPRI